MYHNTTNLKGKALMARQKKAGGVTKQILDIYKSVQDATPWEIYIILNAEKNRHPIADKSYAVKCMRAWNDTHWQNYPHRYPERIPITSVRRAISDLTNKYNELEKTDRKVPGPLGSPEYIWQKKQISNQFPTHRPVMMGFVILAYEPWMGWTVLGFFLSLYIVTYISHYFNNKED